MKRRRISLITAAALLINSTVFALPVHANSLYDSPLYPTPDGVALTEASYNQAAPDWSDFDQLMIDIQTEMDHEVRATKMHHAEDILMETAAVLPIAYLCDAYLQKADLGGIYSSSFGAKYFYSADQYGDALKINIGGEPQSLDPAVVDSADCVSIVVNLFSGLYTYNEEGFVIADLADHDHPYDLSEDGTTYTLHLMEGLTWSDGSPLTAADFEYSWKRLADPGTGAPNSYLAQELFAYTDDGSIDVRASDDFTLIAHLNDPCPYFTKLLAMPIFFPVKQSVVEEADIYGNNPVAWVQEAGFITNGPYTAEEWHHDDALILKKNPYYYAADKVQNETVELMLNSDGVTVFAAYSAGNIAFADNVPANEIPALKKRDDFHIADLLGTTYLEFNVNSFLFKDKTAEQAVNIRKAICLLIDREFIIEDIYQKGQKIATSFIPYGMGDGNGNAFKENSKSYTYPLSEETGYFTSEQSDESTQEAIRLLESAGYQFENGKLAAATPLRIHLLISQTTVNQETAEAIQQDLGEIGIDLDISSRESGVFLSEFINGDFELSLISWVSDFDDPTGMLLLWTSASGNNTCRFGKES